MENEARVRAALADERFARAENPAQTMHDAVLTRPARDDVALLTIEMLPRLRGDISRWTFDSADGAAARDVRTAFINRLALYHGITDADVYAAELIFSELIGNVARHAHGDAEVLVDWTDPAPVLHVLDRGPGFIHTPRLPRDPLAESGRGLFIIASLAQDFNVNRRSVGGSHARAVLPVSRRIALQNA